MHRHFVGWVRVLGLVVCAGLASLVSPAIQAAVVWDESTMTDLSNDRMAPTSIATLAGTNSVRADMPLGDLDYFTIVVPANHDLSGLVLASYAGVDGVSFIGVAEGDVMPIPPDAGTAAGLLGWTHFGDGFGQVGLDILPDIGNGGFFATGFTPPLPSGEYTFWIQQLDGPNVTLQLDFQVTALPVEGLPGDYNGNEVVDAADYTVWRDTFGATGAGLAADGNGDEEVDGEDYDLWKSKFGDVLTPGAASAAPEPGSALLSLAGALVLAAIRLRLRSGRCGASTGWWRR